MYVRLLFANEADFKGSIKYNGKISRFNFNVLNIRFECKTVPWIFEKYKIPISYKMRILFMNGYLYYLDKLWVNNYNILIEDIIPIITVQKGSTLVSEIWSYPSESYKFDCNCLELEINNKKYVFHGDFAYLYEKNVRTDEVLCCGGQFMDRGYGCRIEYQMYDRNKFCNMHMTINFTCGHYRCFKN